MRYGSKVIGLILLVGIIWWLVDGIRDMEARRHKLESSDQAPAEQRLIHVVVSHSKAEKIVETIGLRGITKYSRNLTLRSETSGRVVSELIKADSEVRAGQLLCQIEIGDRLARKREIEAQLLKAQADANAAEELAREGYSSQNAAIAAQSALEAAQAHLEQIRIELDRTKITAPFTGIIREDTAEYGSFMQPGGVCAQIYTLDPIIVVAHAGASEIANLQIGNKVQISIDNAQSLEGVVSLLSREADQTTRTFEIEVSAPNEDNQIRAGLTAEITIQGRQLIAHKVPLSALIFGESGQIGVMLVTREDIAQFIPVEILQELSGQVVIDGLPDEVTLILYGQDFVKQGQKVRATPFAEAPTL